MAGRPRGDPHRRWRNASTHNSEPSPVGRRTRPMTQSFAEMLAETLEYVERALGRVEKGDDAETEAHNIRAYLVNTLELIDSDPDIDAAADELYATVATYVTAGCEREDRGA